MALSRQATGRTVANRAAEGTAGLSEEGQLRAWRGQTGTWTGSCWEAWAHEHEQSTQGLSSRPPALAFSHAAAIKVWCTTYVGCFAGTMLMALMVNGAEMSCLPGCAHVALVS